MPGPPRVGLKLVLKAALPPFLWEIARRAAGRPPLPLFPPPAEVAPPAIAPGPPAGVYETLYEAHGARFSDEDVVGIGNFDVIGRIELEILRREGLAPTHTLLDFGCGTGRLAVHAIPWLVGGHYIGVDVSPSMLDRARARIARVVPSAPCRVSWVKQSTWTFPFAERSADMICAFSVFTHIEHEDTYRYLQDALRIVRPGGRLVFTCLPLSAAAGRKVFLQSAELDARDRWSQVRNVTTSVDLMEAIARLAGWRVARWLPGDEANAPLPDGGGLVAFGQSTGVLEAPASPAPPTSS